MPALAFASSTRRLPVSAAHAREPAGSSVDAALLALARAHGFYSGIYIHLGHALGVSPPSRVLASSTVAYSQFGEALPRSGIARRAASAHKPFAWSCSDEPVGLMQVGQAAVTIPVQDHASGPALVTLVGVDRAFAEALVCDHTPELMAAAADIHMAAITLPAQGRHGLTPREIECLRFAASGATVEVTAKAIGVASRTVEFHLKNVCDKLGATNKIHAVAIATGQGLIQI